MGIPYRDGSNSVTEEECEEADALTMVAGRPLERDAVYRIVTKVGDLTNGQSAPFTEYYTSHPEALPPKLL